MTLPSRLTSPRVGRASANCDLECEAKHSIAEGSAIPASVVVTAGRLGHRSACGASARMPILTGFPIIDNITERPPDRALNPMTYLCNHLSNLYIVQNTLATGAESCVRSSRMRIHIESYVSVFFGQPRL